MPTETRGCIQTGSPVRPDGSNEMQSADGYVELRVQNTDSLSTGQH